MKKTVILLVSIMAIAIISCNINDKEYIGKIKADHSGELYQLYIKKDSIDYVFIENKNGKVMSHLKELILDSNGKILPNIFIGGDSLVNVD